MTFYIKLKLFVCIFLLGALVLAVAQSRQEQKPAESPSSQAMSLSYGDLKWQAMLPELGEASPQIAILRVDANTHATQLLIRRPKRMHVPVHWHSANETHTVIRGIFTFEHDGKRDTLGPGGFNYIPAKMNHQAWASDDSLVFITVDGAWDTNWVNGPPTKADIGKVP